MGRMHVHVRLLACVWLVVGRLLAGVLLVVWRRLAWVLMVRLLARGLLLVRGRLLARDRLALHHLSLVGAWLLWVALLWITPLWVALLWVALLTVAALHRLTLTWSCRCRAARPCVGRAPCETEGKSCGLFASLLFGTKHPTRVARRPLSTAHPSWPACPSPSAGSWPWAPHS